MTVAEQLQWARRMLDHAEATTVGVWPRASALLARHALEELLEEFWAVHSPPLAIANRRAQMVALRGYPAMADSVAIVRVAYAGLSSGCHHHPYELPPTRAELDGLIAAVEGFAGVVAKAVTLDAGARPGAAAPKKPSETAPATPRPKRAR
jgi:hypothetical protein